MPLHLKSIWKNSIDGLKANLIPGIVLQIIGLAIVLVYYFFEPAQAAFTAIADLKTTYGYLYSAIATALFGGLIPFLYLYSAGLIPKSKGIAFGLFFVIYWTCRGVEVDALYRLQDSLFGSALNWQTIVTKVCFDQFIYCPLWSAPVTSIFYGWKDDGFTWRSFKAQFTKRLFTFEIPSVLLSIWLVWIPATAIIYSLPLPLQVPLFNLVLCFFVLLVSVLDRSQSKTT